MKNLSVVNMLSVTLLGSTATGFLCLTLMDASIKSLLLLSVSTILCLLLVRSSAATRHLIWVSTMVGLLLIPACAFVLPQWRVLPAWLTLENRIEPTISVVLPPPNNGALQESLTPAQPTIEQEFATHSASVESAASLPPIELPATQLPKPIRLSASLVLGAWGTGFGLCLLPILFGMIRLRFAERAFRPSSSLSPKIVRKIEKLATEQAIAMPHVLVGPSGLMPMVWSFWRSRLLLPADVEQWSAAQLHAVLLHEMVHLKRHDPAWFLAAMLARSVNWFNPLAWYAVRRLRIECERACDDQVLQLGIEPSEYATHLLAMSTTVRGLRGTGSMAMGMASKPNVESRIVSILNAKANRRGVTLTLATSVIIATSLGAAAISTLAATAKEKEQPVSQDQTVQEETVQTKYPYCIVEAEGLKLRPLAEAVAAFNKQSLESPIGAQQPPITEEESLSEIKKFSELNHVSEPTKEILREILKTQMLPANVYFRRFTRLDDEDQMQGVWWVRLVIEGAAPPYFSVPVRSTSLFSRPYTQMERQQNAEQALSLINRFVSFYDELPTAAAKLSLPDKAQEQLVARAQSALDAKNLAGLQELFLWDNASDSTRTFVTSELQLLLRSKVHSITFKPLALKGNLRHWSAFQSYQPNLPIVGHLELEYEQPDVSGKTKAGETYLLQPGDILRVHIDGVLPYKSTSSQEEAAPRSSGDGVLDTSKGYPIVVQGNGTIALPSISPISVSGKSIKDVRDLIVKAYTDAKIFSNPESIQPTLSLLKARSSGPKRLLSLEVGLSGGKFRLVNYVILGERELPKDAIQGLSIRGFNEQLGDGSRMQTDLITNPGSLLSAHLANEEVRIRGARKSDRTDLTNQSSPRVFSDKIARNPGALDDLKGNVDDEDSVCQGEVTQVTKDGKLVWINLGKVNGLRPGQAFSVVDGDRNDPDAKIKARIKVLHVEERIARCISDQVSTPILRGDGVYSATWKPVPRVKFALAGTFDVDGDGQDDRELVEALIEEKRGEVVFDLLSNGQATGEFTADIQWLVTGSDFKQVDKDGEVVAKAKMLGISQIQVSKLLGWFTGKEPTKLQPETPKPKE